MKRRKSLALAVTITLFLLIASTEAKNMFTWRGVILPSLNFRSTSMVNDVKNTFLPRMKKAGYNCLFLDGAWMIKLHKIPTFKAGFQDLVARAKTNGITCIPMSQGQSVTDHMDEKLVEAFPNFGTPFVVNGGSATPKGDSQVQLYDGGFEKADFRTHWKGSGLWQIDKTVKRSGSASLRIIDPKEYYQRMTQKVMVKPHRTYELSMWVKTKDVHTFNGKYGDMGARESGFTVQAPKGIYILNDRGFRNGLDHTNDWKKITQYFNSLDQSAVFVEVQATQGGKLTGTQWYDDVTITEVGLHETVNRTGMPVVVKDNKGKKYGEGSDYVVKNRMLQIPAGSSIQNGQELLVDWYMDAVGTVLDRSSPAFCYQNVWEGMRKQIKLEDDWFSTPPAKMMKFSEWRMAGWDPLCISRYNINQVGSGPYMGAVASKTAEYYKEANCSRIALVFNDAFDPHANAKARYWVINKGGQGAGHHLDEDIIIMNWNVHKRISSLKFFAGTEGKDWPGFGVKKDRNRQIISSGVGAWGDWLTKISQLEKEGSLPDGSVIGMAYHTYKAFPAYYSQVENMAAACNTAGRWGTGPVPFPAKTPGCQVGITEQPKRAEARSMPAMNVRSIHSNGSKAFKIFLPWGGDVRLSVVNLKGQVVARILDGQTAAGSHERRIDTSKMAPGVYFVRLSVMGESVQSVTRKMAVF